MRSYTLAGVTVLLVVAAVYLLQLPNSGECPPPSDESQLTTGGRIDWVPLLPTPQRIIAVRPDDEARAKESLAKGDIPSGTVFDIETLGPLSDGDRASASVRLIEMSKDCLIEVFKQQAAMEGGQDDGMPAYRKLLELYASYQGAMAAESEFAKGKYGTLDTRWTFKKIPLPPGYKYLGITLHKAMGGSVLVVVPYKLEDHPDAKQVLDEARSMRGLELDEFAREFNSRTADARRMAITLHLAARSALLKRGAEPIAPTEMSQLTSQLLPGPFVIDKVNQTIRAPRL